jgi:hypothetical protein
MTVRTLILALGLWALPLVSTPAQQEKKAKPLSARLEVEAHRESFTARLYLKNHTQEDIEVVYGYGNSGMTVVPRLRVGDVSVSPPTYTRPGSRAQRPNKRRIPAGKEVLYGTFTMGYPLRERELKDAPVRAFINFRERKESLQTPEVPLTIPAWKPK